MKQTFSRLWFLEINAQIKRPRVCTFKFQLLTFDLCFKLQNIFIVYFYCEMIKIPHLNFNHNKFTFQMKKKLDLSTYFWVDRKCKVIMIKVIMIFYHLIIYQSKLSFFGQLISWSRAGMTYLLLAKLMFEVLKLLVWNPLLKAEIQNLWLALVTHFIFTNFVVKLICKFLKKSLISRSRPNAWVKVFRNSI